jgi:hypothetical protein
MINAILNLQNFNLRIGLNLAERLVFCFKGRIAIIRMDITRASTPPSLLGIERRMA